MAKATESSPQFLSAKETAARYGVAVSTVYRWVEEGNMPAPVKPGPGVTRWNVDTLKLWEAKMEGVA